MKNSESAVELLNDPLMAWMLPVYIIALVLSIWQSVRRKNAVYAAADTWVSLSMLVASAIVDVLPKLAAVALMLWLAPLSPLQEAVGRQWWAWLLLFVLDDLCYYLFHRSNHEWRLLWAGHVNHHSSQHLNLATALRQGVGVHLTPTKKRRTGLATKDGEHRAQRMCRVCQRRGTSSVCSGFRDGRKVEVFCCGPKTGRRCFDQHMREVHELDF
mgnify:CR=1 FL=1